MNSAINFFHLDSPLLKDITTYLISVILLVLILSTVYYLGTKALKRLNKKYEHNLLLRVIKNLKFPVILLIVILSLWLPLSFARFSESIVATTGKILTLLTIANFSWIGIRLIQLTKFFILRQYNMDQKDNLRARKIYTQFKIIERVATFVIILIALSLALMTFKSIREIGVSLIASAGISGIIIGFAAQKVLGGILAGIQLAITQPIRIDDVVIVENEWGNIEEINLTYVVVKIWDQRRLILPTTYFIETPFQNWTRTNSDILGTVFIYTDYTVPFDELRKELTRLLSNTDLWDGKVNVLQVTDSTEKTVEIRALVSASDSPTAWNLRVYIRENLIQYLQKKHPDSLPKSRIVFESNEHLSTIQ